MEGFDLNSPYQLIIIPTKPTIHTTEQSINHIIKLKQFVMSINPIYAALTGARGTMLYDIREVNENLSCLCVC
jgi:DNA mismatch repair protein MSH4